VKVRPLLFGRVFAAGVGIAYGWAGAVTVAKIFPGLSTLRTFRWPLYTGEAAVLFLIAALTLAGTTLHVADLFIACLTIVMLMVARYDSESALAPAVGISTALLVFIYVRGGWGSIRQLHMARKAALLLAVVFAVMAIWRMEETPERVEWQRLRTRSGSVQLRAFRFPGSCEGYFAGGKDISEIDSGCIDAIPAKRAGYVIAFTTLSGALAIAAVAGAPKVRRLSDGLAVPTWT
jgi:hypothetical protein